MASLVLIAAVVAVALWFWLNTREKRRLAQGLAHHSGLRLIFASVGILIVLFAGGCGAFVLADHLTSNYGGGGDNIMSWELIAVFTLPPVLIGALIWWVSMRRNS